MDMAKQMGPTTSVAHILQKLTVIFGTVASFDVLMQNFYKVTKSSHEKVPSFATRLEGTLNQIRLKYPRRIVDQEVQQHLKDHLFHGVHKHMRLNMIPLQQFQNHLLPTHDHCLQSREWEQRSLRQGEG